MNKAELIDRLSTHLGSRRDATLAVEALVDVVIREVAAGGSVGITGFGTFERADRAPRTGRNPRTGESVPIAGTSTPRFRPGTYFKQVMKDPKVLPAKGLAGGRAPAGSAGTASKSTAGKTTAGKTTTAKATTRRTAKGASTGTRSSAASKGKSTSTRSRSAAAPPIAAEDVAAVETKLKDSARKTLKKSQEADKKSKKAKDSKAAKGKKKDKKSKKK